MQQVDIRGLDKVVLLRKLWENMKVAAFFEQLPWLAPPFVEGLASDAVGKYIDYFCGRCIKCDLSKDTVDPFLYDRDAGAGAFARIVAAMQK